MRRVVCGWMALHAKEMWRGVEQVYIHSVDWVEGVVWSDLAGIGTSGLSESGAKIQVP